jgi:hypothetical protein
MARICSLACSLLLAVAVFGCGGSKREESAGGPLAPGPVDGPAPGPLPVPSPGFPHGYFTSLSARSNVLGAYSLRDQEMLNTYAHGPGSGSISFTYDFVNDLDPRKQDAAKVTIPADKAHVQSQVRLPIPPIQGDSLLVTWDAWWGKEFAYAHAHIGNYKAFQFASPADQIWTEVKSDFDKAVRFPPAVAMVEIRAYGERKNGELGPNVTNENPLSPMAAQFAIMPETWTRYWAYFRPTDQWHEFSLWMADETRDPVLVIHARQMKPNRGAEGWESFWLEYNTSGGGVTAARGPLVSYVRNVVMLRAVSEVSALLERPTR